MICDIFINALSGVVSNTICWPLETVKVQNQARFKPKPLFNSIKYIIKKDKFSGLFRGLIVGNVAVAVCYGTFFTTYDLLKNVLKPYIGGVHIIHTLSGYLATLVASSIDNPLYVIKTQYQTKLIRGKPGHMSLIKMVLDLYKLYGINVFYKGLLMTYVKNIEMAIQMPLYEFFKENIGINGATKYILSSFLSKTIATTIMYPLDTIRTIRRAYPNMILKNSILYTYKSGFFKGYSAHFIRTIPCSVITFAVRELLMN